MNLLPFGVTAIGYLIASAFFILALKGMSAPATARNGNLLGAAGAFLAVVITLFSKLPGHAQWHNQGWIIGAIAIGCLIGVVAARKVAMTQMPQLVALFNGVGGAAAMLVALLELHGEKVSLDAAMASAFTILVGSVSFAGSIITFLKLQELMPTRPITFPGGPPVFVVVNLLAFGIAGWVVVQAIRQPVSLVWLLALVSMAMLIGVLFVLPVGGADVPIVISLLNAFTGLSVAASGYVLDNVLLMVAGTLVGASGTILTRLMAQAMGRPLTHTLFGAFTKSTDAAVASGPARNVRSGSAEDVAIMLSYASKVILVPGYGLAVAQAQHTLRDLASVLESRGISVQYAIHPVAGRMPGHMNVLLAEADVPYESLKEMDDINPEFATADVALVVGANDVVNPAARTDTSAPIYGMPILDVDQAAQVVFLKRSMRPGFAGIENELLFQPKTMLLFGDAKDSLTKVLSEVKTLV